MVTKKYEHTSSKITAGKNKNRVQHTYTGTGKYGRFIGQATTEKGGYNVRTKLNTPERKHFKTLSQAQKHILARRTRSKRRFIS